MTKLTDRHDDSPVTLRELLRRMRRLEKLLRQLLARDIPQEHYTVEEFARKIGGKPFSVRQNCNRHRLNAAKTANGRQWVLTHVELLRFRKEGLLPDPNR